MSMRQQTYCMCIQFSIWYLPILGWNRPDNNLDWPWRDVSSERWAECSSVAVLPRQIAVQCDEQMNGQTYRSVSIRVVLPHGIRRRVYCDSHILCNVDWLALQYCIRQMACSVECWPARAIAVINDVCCCQGVCCCCSCCVCQVLVLSKELRITRYHRIYSIH